jgi:hypothetical protein
MITEGEWESIAALVKRIFSTRAESFVTGRVTRVDGINNNVYMSEFGQQPIPMVAQDLEITYYDTVWNPATSKNVAQKKTAKVKVVMPKKGDTVVCVRELGTHRIPRCLGKLIGKKWIMTGLD